MSIASTPDRLRTMFRNEMFREKPLRTSARIAFSLVRKRIARLQRAIVSYDGGRARVIVDLCTPLGLSLYRYGIHDPDVEIVKRLLTPGDLFVDGGANIGLFTLAAAARVGSAGSDIAFEPADTTRRDLQANVNLNDFRWVDIRSEAIADICETRKLTVFSGTRAGLSSFEPGVEGGHSVEVSTTTLDKVLATRRPRLVKLDLEGAEHAALLGSQNLLSARRTCFLIELEQDHLARQGASAQMVISLLQGAGYELYGVGWDRFHRPAVARGVMRREGASPNVLAVPDASILVRAGVSVLDANQLR